MKKSLILVAIISTCFCQAQKIVESIDGKFKYPIGVTADNQGNIYIADTQNNEIKIWDIDSKKLQILEKTNTLYPQQMATDFSTGLIYFADTNNHQIKQINPKTKEVSIVDKNVSWGTPYNIALDKNGNLFYTEFFHKGIKTYNFKNHEFKDIEIENVGDDLGIAIDIDGNVLLGDRDNKVILKYDLTKNTLEKLPINEEIEPRDLDVDKNGYIYFFNNLNYSIVRYDPKTKNTTIILNDNYLLSTEQITLDEKGFLYVAEAGNSKIYKVELPQN